MELVPKQRRHLGKKPKRTVIVIGSPHAGFPECYLAGIEFAKIMPRADAEIVNRYIVTSENPL